MVRIHSIRATVKEILQVSKALDVVKIGIVGEPSTGKTSLAYTLAHLIHKISNEIGYVPFAFREFGEEQFLDMKKTLETLSPTNYVLYFHDLSFLSDKKRIEEVKQCITKIRHLREDVKIILIYDYHYTLGLDKYLRQANFRYFTSVGSSEDDNMIKIVGTKYTQRISEFQQMFVQMTTQHKATFRMGKKFFMYSYKNPFVVCLFFNNARLRYVVFPLREWIDKLCPTCSSGRGHSIQCAIPIDQFIKEGYAKFGEGTFRSAVKLKLFTNGINVYTHKVSQASRWLDLALEKKQIGLEDITTELQLVVSKARLRKKLDGVLA